MKRNDMVDGGGRLKVSLWSQYYGVPLFVFIGLGTFSLYMELFPAEGTDGPLHWAWSAMWIAIGIVLFFVQRNKLKFRTLGTLARPERFKAEVRKIMQEEGWSVILDNKLFMQAYHTGYALAQDTITLKFDRGMVLYNVIKDPHAYRAGLLCLTSRCKRGKRLIKKIKRQTKIDAR
jgi:hypothetical protein